MAQLDLQHSNRQAIRERLTSTHAGFHTLLDGLTDDDLRRHTGNPAWTVGAILTHLVWSLELLPREVASARKGQGMFNMPPMLRDVLLRHTGIRRRPRRSYQTGPWTCRSRSLACSRSLPGS